MYKTYAFLLLVVAACSAAPQPGNSQRGSAEPKQRSTSPARIEAAPESPAPASSPVRFAAALELAPTRLESAPASFPARLAAAPNPVFAPARFAAAPVPNGTPFQVVAYSSQIVSRNHNALAAPVAPFVASPAASLVAAPAASPFVGASSAASLVAPALYPASPYFAASYPSIPLFF